MLNKERKICLIGRKLSKKHVESLRRSHPRFPRETRTCALPDCDITFECIITSDRQYCSKSCGRIATVKKLPRETRTCVAPNCEVTFEVSIHSTQKYCGLGCSTKNARSFIQHCSKERVEKISDSVSKLYLEGFRPRTSYDDGWVATRIGEKVYCRSSYEKQAVNLLNSFEDVISIKAEPLRIPYEINGIRRYYLPDLLVSTAKGDLYLIEVKPRSQIEEERNQIKFVAACNYAKKHNMIFLIWTEEIIFSNKNGSTTTSLQEIVEDTAASLKV